MTTFDQFVIFWCVVAGAWLAVVSVAIWCVILLRVLWNAACRVVRRVVTTHE